MNEVIDDNQYYADEKYFNDLMEDNSMEVSLAEFIKPWLRDRSIETAALDYASRGWSVFPSPSGTKKSFKSADHSDGRPWGATVDVAEIRRDFMEWPNANVGIVCGVGSGIFVVEADTKEGHDVDGIASLVALEGKHGTFPPTFQAISPSGSVHYYFRHPGAGFNIKNSASAIAAGVDVRGDGGIVIGVPSVKPGKGVYRWLNELPIADAPAWLLDLVVTKETAKAALSITDQALAMIKRPDVVADTGANDSAYIAAVLRGEYDAVVKLSNGRNDQLNISACKLGHYVAGRVLDEQEAIDRLMAACEASGLLADDGNAQCLATIASGMKKGKTDPKGIPERKTAEVIPFPGATDANEATPADAMPTIEIKDGQLSELATKAEAMLIDAGVPIYQRGGKLVRPIIETVDASRGRKTKIAQLRILDAVYLRDLMGRHAKWERYDGRAKKKVPTNPPFETAATVLAREGDWNFKTITGVISTPTMRPDGSLLMEQGYDEATGLLLVEPPKMPTIPDEPTREHALEALALIEALLTGFPFVDDVSKSVALSALISPVVRGAFPVLPMHASRAPEAGTGKSFLWDTVASIAIGQPMPVMSTGANVEETEKRLGAAMLAGQPLISIDNISGELGGDALCQIIERPVVEIRILQKSERVRIEARGTSTFATGINFVIAGDLCRRVITVNLDAAVERPEFRQFAFDPVDRVLSNRGAYVAAALTICRAYFVVGRPDKAPRLASFEGWSDTVRSALIWLGKADPVLSMESARAEDPERLELSDMMEAWGQVIGIGPDSRVRLADVILKGTAMSRPAENEPLEPDNPDLFAALDGIAHRATGKKGQKPDVAMLGLWLRKFKGRVIDGKRFANHANPKGGSVWWVEELLTGA